MPAPATDLRAIYREHAPYVWRVLKYLGVADADQKDVMQEVFVVVHRRLPSFDGRSALRTWVHGICVRVAADHRRKAYRRREVPTAEPRDEELAPRQLEHVERDELRRLLLEAMEALSDEQRTAITLHDIEGHTMKEITTQLGWPLQTGYSRLHAARRILARAIEERRAQRPAARGEAS